MKYDVGVKTLILTSFFISGFCLGDIKIKKAKWGVHSSWKDVTDKLSKNIDPNAEKVVISNESYGKASDGAFSGWQVKMFGKYFWGTKKKLKVDAEIDGKSVSIEVSEGKPLVLESSSVGQTTGTIKVVSARWGAEGSWQDVTDKLNAAISSKASKINFNDKDYGTKSDGVFSSWQTKMFGSYFAGTRKKLKLDIEIGGVPVHMENHEGEPLVLDSSNFPSKGSAGISILDAQWGAEKSWKDVTSVLSKNIGQNVDKIDISNESYGSDKDGAFDGWQVKMFGSHLAGTEKALKGKLLVNGAVVKFHVGEGKHWLVDDTIPGMGILMPHHKPQGDDKNKDKDEDKNKSKDKDQAKDQDKDMPKEHGKGKFGEVTIPDDFELEVGTAEKVACGCDSKGNPAAFVIDNNDKVWSYNPYCFTENPWTIINGDIAEFVSLCTSSNGGLAGLASDGKVYKYTYTQDSATAWAAVPGEISNIRHIALSSGKYFAVAGENESIYSNDGSAWQKVTPEVKGVKGLAVGGSVIFALNEGGEPRALKSGVWNEIISPVKIRRISAASEKHVIAVGEDSSLLMLDATGKNFEHVKNDKGEIVRGFAYASINAYGMIFLIDMSGRIYHNAEAGAAITASTSTAVASSTSADASTSTATATTNATGKKTRTSRLKTSKTKTGSTSTAKTSTAASSKTTTKRNTLTRTSTASTKRAQSTTRTKAR